MAWSVEMGGLHDVDSSQRSQHGSQLHPSPMSWGTIAPRPSEAMLLSLAEKGVRWTRAKGSCCEYM
eukprot:876445-Prymnesium_polylepis.1